MKTGACCYPMSPCSECYGWRQWTFKIFSLRILVLKNSPCVTKKTHAKPSAFVCRWSLAELDAYRRMALITSADRSLRKPAMTSLWSILRICRRTSTVALATQVMLEQEMSLTYGYRSRDQSMCEEQPVAVSLWSLSNITPYAIIANIGASPRPEQFLDRSKS